MKIIQLLFLTIITTNLTAQSFTGINIDNGFACNTVHAGDLNSDGFNDIVATSQADSVNWYENNHDGSFTTHELVNISGMGARDAKIADLNGDGHLDIALVADLNTTLYWFENDGLGAFTQHIISSSLSNANSIFITDMDNDNDVDLVTSSYGFFGTFGLTNYFKNNGTGTFVNHNILNDSAIILSATALNISSTDQKDIVIAHTQSDKIRWFKHNNDTTFTEQTAIDSDVPKVSGLFAMDLDNDGDFDIVSAAQDSNRKVRWHENVNQVFSTHIIAMNSQGGESVFATDIDLDGDIDIISSNPSAIGTTTIHYNDGEQNFTATSLPTNMPGTNSSFAIDLDNNGSLDIISAATNGVWIHTNSLSDNIFKNGFE